MPVEYDDGVHLPGTSERTTVIGSTGSGKTRFGTWLLSKAPFQRQPYTIVDHKREGLFSGIDRIRQIGYNEVPTKPGLYLLQPDGGDDVELDDWLTRTLRKGDGGIYVDEGYEIKQHSLAFRRVLTQGRSQNVPVITVSQRPSQISRFAFSEASFFAFFRLSLADDRKTAQSYAPRDRINLDNPLPPYHSFWYDVARDKVTKLGPVPSDEEILDAIDRKLAPQRKIV